VLILFDIDATLLKTGGAGMLALADAGRLLFGPAFSAEGVAFAGRLDPLIIGDLLVRNGIAPTPEHRGAMRRGYREALEARFAAESGSWALPGVHELLGALAGLADRDSGGDGARPTLGLLTGNFSETGTLKLKLAGIDPEGFRVCVWGDDSPHDPPEREHLPGVALERASAAWGRPARGAEVVVIGDTPHDISCARAHGCRVLAVATGQFSVADLGHADRTVEDLSETEEVVRWLMG